MGYFLLFVTALGLALCLDALQEGGKAKEFFDDHHNKKKVRKCFGQEGMNIYFNDVDWVCDIYLFHKGANHYIKLPYAKVMKLYLSNPKGEGMRKLMLEKVKGA